MAQLIGIGARVSAWQGVWLSAVTALGLVVLAAAILTPPESRYAPWWLRALGAPLTLLFFILFFVATSVLGDARRAVGKHVVGDCTGTWICIMGYPFFDVSKAHITLCFAYSRARKR